MIDGRCDALMKYYPYGSKDKSKYITRLAYNKDSDSLTVFFADNKSYLDIENTAENIEAIKTIMDQQMQEAMSNKYEFLKDSILTTGTTVLLASLGSILLNEMYQNQATQETMFLTGAVVISACIQAIRWSVPVYSRVAEISKIEYRDFNAKQLGAIGSYPHALDSSRPEIKKLCAENPDAPFSILNVDSYTTKDLKTIIKEMDREDSISEGTGITYVKRK